MLHFHSLFIKHVAAETAQAVVITFAIPPDLRDEFSFAPGQFLTLKAQINGEFIRRSYSICSSLQAFEAHQKISVAIKQVDGGVFSSWAQNLQAGDELDVMPPDGRFVSQAPAGAHRLCIAAGSGITPMMSLMASNLAADPAAQFTLIYGNQSLASTMFLETLQDLKDRYASRVSLIQVFSRQSQELPRFNGRLDRAKLDDLLANLVPTHAIHEAFVCGPEGMIEAAVAALQAAGMPPESIRTERFATSNTPKFAASDAQNTRTEPQNDAKIALTIIADGVKHELRMRETDTVLEVALEAGLDLPYSCKGGVCCTCRAKVTAGSVKMLKNFTLEAGEVAQGFALTCQSCPTSAALEISFDER